MRSVFAPAPSRRAPAQRGFGVVEVVVAASIILAVVAAVATAFFSAHALARATSDTTHANLLLDETGEALQFLRDVSWTDEIATVPLDTSYYLVRESDGYHLSSTSQVLGNYYVTVTFAAVRRDGDGAFDENGSVDSSSREAIIDVYRFADDVRLATGALYVHDAHEN